MRDMKSTLGEAHMIPLPLYVIEDDIEESFPSIEAMIPKDCIYTAKAVECGIRNLDAFIQEHLNAILKWETIILIYGELSGNDQDEIMFSSDCDTIVRESVCDSISRFLTGKPWPMYGTNSSDKATWKLFMVAACNKYSRPQEKF